MPSVTIELNEAEYKHLVALAQRERRTPENMAAVIVVTPPPHPFVCPVPHIRSKPLSPNPTVWPAAVKQPWWSTFQIGDQPPKYGTIC